ncbi:DUF3784 domain-containing protein [Algoriphagus sp. NG3]|uniref:DUF3784 domain-containing protein n=1 Tax=Algoriphagus sp. NG3 TaxID=3097546 RepID=UPI002A8094E8|nr:DUF3784 domain-containing protein [Algoriphagus sp. NG3]WPR77131.1 DUF3784 domain-containing protein [Algoriphagus sp. NG3]
MASIYIGLLFIAIGIVVKLFPNLIAGYNNLSHKEKENALTNGLPTFASIVFGMMGLIIIVGHYLELGLDMPSLGRNLVIISSLAGSVILIVFGNRFTAKKNSIQKTK